MVGAAQNEHFLDHAQSFLERAGYQSAHIARDYRFSFPAVAGRLFETMTVPLVAFSSWPHTMRTACVSAIDHTATDQPIRTTLNALRYLAAPLALVKEGDAVQLWPVRHRIPEQPLTQESSDKWQDSFQTRLSDFSPMSIAEAKRGHQQLVFVDSDLHEWAAQATREAVRSVLDESLQMALRDLGRQRTSEQEKQAIHLVFQLFASRVLQDKGVLDHTDVATVAIASAREAFPNCFSSRIPGELKEAAIESYARICTAYSYASVNSDMLGHAYENTMLTKKHRTNRGIYYTPQSIASYILESLPIESIPQNERAVYDPCCGSGSFLLTAFSRLNALLPEDWSTRKRHTYLRDRLLGTDTDAFAVGIAKLSLVLADPTSRDGWEINESDALQPWELERRPRIVVTNPPFGESKGSGTRREVAVDILTTVLDQLPQESLIGVVLPQSILESETATELRKNLLDTCNILELAIFPGGMFYSNAEIAVLLLRKTAEQRSSSVLIRELKGVDLNRFNTLRDFSRTYPANQDAWRTSHNFEFSFSPLSDLWERIESQSTTLGSVARIDTGLQVYKEDTESVSERKKSGYKPYVSRFACLRPFAFLCEHEAHPYRWLKFDTKKLRRVGNAEMYEHSKVLINATRNPASTWRIIAAIANKPVYFNDNFHGIQPTDPNLSLEEIAAVLNSHVANGWLDAHLRKRKLIIRTLERMPFPIFSERDSVELKSLVRQMERAVISKQDDVGGLFFEPIGTMPKAAEIQQSIDTIIFRAYGLSSSERNLVERLMSIDKRPGC